jgi:hypothetical protein
LGPGPKRSQPIAGQPRIRTLLEALVEVTEGARLSFDECFTD